MPPGSNAVEEVGADRADQGTIAIAAAVAFAQRQMALQLAGLGFEIKG